MKKRCLAVQRSNKGQKLEKIFICGIEKEGTGIL